MSVHKLIVNRSFAVGSYNPIVTDIKKQRYMSKSTFKILFYIRKNQVNKDGTVCIMVRLTVSGDVTQFSSKLNVDQRHGTLSREKRQAIL